MDQRRVTVIRRGRLLDHRARRAEPADVLIEGDTIREVGPPGLAAPADATVLDASGRLLHPGLINAHTHCHGALAKGMGDRWSLELLLTAAPWISGQRTREDQYLAAQLNALEMVLKGCTAAYDLFYEYPAPSLEGLEAVGRAYLDVGMRAVIAPMVADTTFFRVVPGLIDQMAADLRREVESFHLAPGETTLANIAHALKSWPLDPGWVRLAVAPTIPLHCADDFMISCARLARQHEVGLHTHLAESKVQALIGMERYGETLTAHLQRIGLLGSNFTAAHAVWLDDDDAKRIADHGGSIAHNPSSNMRLGSGLADVRTMLRAGVNVGIGTDGSSCGDNQNMFEAMRLASFVSRVHRPQLERWLTTDEVVEAATVGSARALGFGDRLGRIAPGYQADIVLLDLGHVNWLPLNDPTNQLVHTEDGNAVHSVLIGGRMVVEGRRPTMVDAADLARKAEAARARLAEATEPMRALFERLAPVVGSFCSALAARPYHVRRLCADPHR
jgi:5-methylthioadenosine/S-adenosylhomocysteine deaminase